jgi:hypothetical protein
MDMSYDREIPKELIKGCHTYIIHFNYISYADFLTKSRTKAIEYLQKNKLEIMEIKLERNEYGLNDYRIMTRK